MRWPKWLTGESEGKMRGGAAPARVRSAAEEPGRGTGSIDEPGMRIVRHAYRTLQIDQRWSVWDNRGFTWWGHEQAQRVWAEAPYESYGATIYRVHAETDFLWGEELTPRAQRHLGAVMRMAGLSGAYHDSATGLVRLRASVYAHEGNEAWLRTLFSHAAILQAADARDLAGEAAQLTDLIPAFSAHPETGWRRDPDEMLGAVAFGRQQAAGRRPAWAGSPEFASVAAQFRRLGDAANGDGCGLAVELGFGPNPGPAPVGTSALLQAAPEQHPRYGSGLLLRLSLPFDEDRQTPGGLPLRLNALDGHARDGGHLLGSWCSAPDGTVTFISFVPDVCHMPGLLLNLAGSMSSRVRWVDGRSTDPDPLRAGAVS